VRGGKEKAQNMNIKRVLGAFAAGLVVVGTYTAQAYDRTWKDDASGNWTDKTKWTANAYPNGNGDKAIFPATMTGGNTVTIPSGTTINLLNCDFNNTELMTLVLDNGKLYFANNTSYNGIYVGKNGPAVIEFKGATPQLKVQRGWNYFDLGISYDTTLKFALPATPWTTSTMPLWVSGGDTPLRFFPNTHFVFDASAIKEPAANKTTTYVIAKTTDGYRTPEGDAGIYSNNVTFVNMAETLAGTLAPNGNNLELTIAGPIIPDGAVARVGHYGYLTLAEAFAAAKDGQTIYMLANATLDKTVFVDKNVTLDLGAYSVRGNVDGLALTDGYATKDTLFCVLYGASLTVKGTGEINYGGNASVYSAIKLTDANDAREGEEVASLTVEGGTIVGYYYGINGHGNRQGTAITVNGGTIRGTAENDNAGIFNPQAGTLTVNGGAIEGAVGIYMKAGVVETTVKAGTIAANGIAKPYQTTGDGFVATGDALVIDNAGYPGGAPAADIVGGTFTSANGKAVASYAKTGFTPVGGFLRGGLYNTEPDTAFIAEGFKKQPLAGEWWRVSKDGPVVATINGYEYETLAEAYDAAEDGETILLVTNEATTAMLTLTKNVTIDLGTGCELKPAEGDTLFTVDGGNVTISGATLKGGVVLATGTLNMNATIDATGAAITANGGTLNVTGGSYTGTESAFVAGADFDPAKSTIDSGSFSSEIPAAYLKANRKTKEVGGRYVVVLAADEKNITYTWKGGAAGDWADEANWTPSTTPCFGIPTKGYGNAQVTAKFPSNTPMVDWNTWINLGGGDYQVNSVLFQFGGILNLTNGTFNAQAGMISVGDTRLRVKDGVIRTTDPIFGNIQGSNFELDGNVKVFGDVAPHGSTTKLGRWDEDFNELISVVSNEVTGIIRNRNTKLYITVSGNSTLVVGEIRADANASSLPLATSLAKGATMKVGQIVAADVAGKLDFTFNVAAAGYAAAPVSFAKNDDGVALDSKTAVTVNIDEGFATGKMPLFSGVGLSSASLPSVTVKVGGTALEPTESLKIGLEEKDGVIYLSIKKNGMMLYVK